MSRIHINSKIPITKGWSGDKKYCVTSEDGTKHLLRISPAEQLDRKKLTFNMMEKVVALGVPMCQPVEFGVCEEGVYSLQSWIDGEDGEDLIPLMSTTKQYTYGLDAGRILRQIHSLPAPAIEDDWETKFNCKIDRKIKMYNECHIKYENGQAFIDYINANRHLLKGRPQCYQHGDYHIGNMMIDSNGNLQIIDFDRDDYGDPWEEFNRIVWCAQASPSFATGMVKGYFNDDVPMNFWRLLALYISSNTLSSVPWAIPFGQDEIDTMINQANDVLNWYDDMKNPVPTWYEWDK
jgi:aminoglycoside phosphotransferase (APT) family kinase protein